METNTASPARIASPAQTHPPKVYWRTCGALMLLLALSWGVGYCDLGLFNLVIALGISVTKALLVALIFMHLKGTSGVVRIAASAGIIWLLIMLGLTLGDYFSRGWVPLNH